MIASYVAPRWNSDNTKSSASSARSLCRKINSVAASSAAEAPLHASQKSARRDKSQTCSSDEVRVSINGLCKIKGLAFLYPTWHQHLNFVTSSQKIQNSPII